MITSDGAMPDELTQPASWFGERLLAGASLSSAWELLAALLAIAYLLLAMRERLWCWPAAFMSTLIYTLLFWHVALLMESLLNVYYMAMAIYGFWQWRFGGRQGKGVELHNSTRRFHLLLIAGTAAAAGGLGLLMDTYTRADWAYVDAATTCFAVVTTVLVANKELSSWLYWMVIDAVSIVMYVNKGLWVTALLYVLYIGLALRGYLEWRRRMLICDGAPEAAANVV